MKQEINEKTIVESQDIIERFTVFPVLWLSVFYTLVIYIITVFPVYFSIKIHMFNFVSFFMSFVLTYIVLFVFVFILLAFLYKHKAHNSKYFASLRFLGFYPVLVISRVGISKIDISGLSVSLFFAIISLLFAKIQFFFPFFMFLSLLFLFSLFWGKTGEWTLSP